MSLRGQLPPGYFIRINITFNPWSDKHWLKKRFFDNPNPDLVFSDTTTYKCNEWLSDGDIALFEDMRERYPRRYRVEGLGEWGISEGLIFDNWVERDFNYLDYINEKDYKAIYGIDFGLILAQVKCGELVIARCAC